MADSTSKQSQTESPESSKEWSAADLRKRVEGLLGELQSYSAVRDELGRVMEEGEPLAPPNDYRTQRLSRQERRLASDMVKLALPLMNDSHTFLMEFVDRHPKYQSVCSWFRDCAVYRKCSATLLQKDQQAYEDLDRLKTHLKQFERLEPKNMASSKAEVPYTETARKVFDIVGKHRFETMTNAEIRTELGQRIKTALTGKKSVNAIDSYLKRIRHRLGFPLSSQVKKNRSAGKV